MENCVRCGAKLYHNGENFCPNCGLMDMNQEWEKLEKKNGEKEKKKDD